MPFARATGIGSTAACADHSKSVCRRQSSTISSPVIVSEVVVILRNVTRWSNGIQWVLQDNFHCPKQLPHPQALIDEQSTEYYSPMSKTEILDEILKLNPEERREIRLKLAELDGDEWLDDDDPLTEEQKAMLEARLADIEQHPEKSIPWEDAKRRIEERLGK